jgi:hypothetical protein
VQNGMTALDWAEEGEHVEIAELLSHAMNPTAVTPLPQETQAVAPGPEADQDVAHEDSAFAEANPIDEVGNACSVTPLKYLQLTIWCRQYAQDNMSALIYAAHHGDLAQVQELISKHTDVNLADEVLPIVLYFPSP